MKRSFNKSAAQASVATEPTPAPAPEPQTTALATLGDVGNPQLPASVTTPPESAPYLGFFETQGNEDRKAKLREQLGPLSVGAPYVAAGGKFYRADGVAFCLLGAEVFHCWTVFGGDNREERVWLTKPGFDTFEGKRVTESIRAVLLAIPGSSPLPEELAPAVVLTAGFRSSKCPAIKALSSAVEASKTPEFAKENGKLVEAPPSFRVAGTLKITADVVKGGPNKGRSYGKADMICKPTSMGQATAISEWWTNGGAEEYQEAVRVHNSVVSRLRELVQAE